MVDVPMPGDYEVCGVCGHDHEYDFPYLTEDEFREAQEKHTEADMNDLRDHGRI